MLTSPPAAGARSVGLRVAEARAAGEIGDEDRAQHREHTEDRCHRGHPRRETTPVLAPRYAGHNVLLKVPWQRLRGAREVQEVLVDGTQFARLLPATGAFSQVVIDLPFLARFQGTHHVGAEEVPHFRVFTHTGITAFRPGLWSRAERAEPPWCGS